MADPDVPDSESPELHALRATTSNAIDLGTPVSPLHIIPSRKPTEFGPVSGARQSRAQSIRNGFDIGDEFSTLSFAEMHPQMRDTPRKPSFDDDDDDDYEDDEDELGGLDTEDENQVLTKAAQAPKQWCCDWCNLTRQVGVVGRNYRHFFTLTAGCASQSWRLNSGELPSSTVQHY